MVGKFPNLWISSRNCSSTLLNHESVRSIRAQASGIIAKIFARFSSESGSLTPPGTAHAGWIRLPPSIAMISWPNFRSAMPSLARVGWASTIPRMFRLDGSASMPRSRSGDDR